MFTQRMHQMIRHFPENGTKFLLENPLNFTQRMHQMIRHFPENGTKFLLENPLNARDLFSALGDDWPDLVDWSKTTLDRTTYVQRDYRHIESDVVLRAPLRQPRGQRPRRKLLIYLLIEHQSEPERWILLRVHDYVIQIYKSQLRTLQRRRKDASEKLHLVLPVVFYTGEQTWPKPDAFAELVELSDRFPEQIPMLSPLFLNLGKIPEEQLETNGGFFGWVLRLIQGRHAQPSEFRAQLERVVLHLETMPPTERARWLEFLSYIHALVYHGREPAEHAELQGCIAESVQTDPHRKEVFQMGKTIADSLIEKGLKKGRAQEAVKGRQRTLFLLIQERFGPLPAHMEQTVKATHDIGTLDGWLKRFAIADSLSEIGIPGS